MSVVVVVSNATKIQGRWSCSRLIGDFHPHDDAGVSLDWADCPKVHSIRKPGRANAFTVSSLQESSTDARNGKKEDERTPQCANGEAIREPKQLRRNLAWLVGDGLS